MGRVLIGLLVVSSLVLGGIPTVTTQHDRTATIVDATDDGWRVGHGDQLWAAAAPGVVSPVVPPVGVVDLVHAPPFRYRVVAPLVFAPKTSPPSAA